MYLLSNRKQVVGEKSISGGNEVLMSRTFAVLGMLSIAASFLCPHTYTWKGDRTDEAEFMVEWVSDRSAGCLAVRT